MDNIPRSFQNAVLVVMPVFWLAAIILALNVTSPIVAGPAGILIVFLLFYFFAASSVYVLLRMVLVIWRVITKRSIAGRKNSAYVASVVALGPVFLLALNTLGQIGVVEVTLVVILVGLGCFYVVRRGAD